MNQPRSVSANQLIAEVVRLVQIYPQQWTSDGKWVSYSVGSDTIRLSQCGSIYGGRLGDVWESELTDAERRLLTGFVAPRLETALQANLREVFGAPGPLARPFRPVFDRTTTAPTAANAQSHGLNAVRPHNLAERRYHWFQIYQQRLFADLQVEGRLPVVPAFVEPVRVLGLRWNRTPIALAFDEYTARVDRLVNRFCDITTDLFGRSVFDTWLASEPDFYFTTTGQPTNLLRRLVGDGMRYLLDQYRFLNGLPAAPADVGKPSLSYSRALVAIYRQIRAIDDVLLGTYYLGWMTPYSTPPETYDPVREPGADWPSLFCSAPTDTVLNEATAPPHDSAYESDFDLSAWSELLDGIAGQNSVSDDAPVSTCGAFRPSFEKEMSDLYERVAFETTLPPTAAILESEPVNQTGLTSEPKAQEAFGVERPVTNGVASPSV